MSDTLAIIEQRQRDFDLFSPASDRIADEEILARTGDSEFSYADEEDTNGTEAPAPLSAAIDMATFAKSESFQVIRQAWDDLIENWTAKSENVKLSADERMANQTMALGLKRGLQAAGDIILAAQDRLKNTSTDERALMGDDAQQLIGKLVQAPAPVVHDNRDDLIDSALPKFKKESITPEENARRSRQFIRDIEEMGKKLKKPDAAS